MTVLEDELRKALAGRVATSPVLDDPAGTAIRRARRVRRRRGALTGVAAVVAAVALVSGLMWAQQLRTDSGVAGGVVISPGLIEPDTVAPTPAVPFGAAPAVDLVVGGQIWAADGRRIAVGDSVDRVYRVPSGWLVELGNAVRLVNDTGAALPLPVGSAWAVSADGARVAYATDQRMVVAKLADTGLTTLASADVAAGTVPVTFAGERLVVGETGQTGRIERYGQWSASDSYRPSWTQGLLDVYATPAGDLVALVPAGTAGGTCLARLATATNSLRTADPAACGLVLTGRQSGAISPDGRWLAVADTSAVFLYDLTTVFTQQRAAAACTTQGAHDLVWESAQQVLVADGAGAVRCRTDGRTERVSMPAGLTEGWRFVPERSPDTKP